MAHPSRINRVDMSFLAKINAFEKRLREFCNRNSIQMGVDITSYPLQRKYTFVCTTESCRWGRCYNGIYSVVDYNEVEDISKTYDSLVEYLADIFNLCPEPEAVHVDAINTKHTMYITTVNSHNLQTSVYDKFCENAGFTQRFEFDESSFYSSPEWGKYLKEAINKGLVSYTDKEKEMKVKIEKVYFNAPYTIVIWSDKTKTMVKAENECYDEEKGLAMAICKKFLGTNESGSNYFDEFKKWLPKEEKKVPIGKVKAVVTDPEGGISITVETPVILTPAQFAAIAGRSVSTIRKDCARGLHPGAKKVDGKWMIPYAGMVRR